ncbi:hypothetical protein [Microbacterium sp. LWH11-1.2]|uniref:hypothetical protein n=1 Tax=Microbacterium sp. LWH11-1.2 TaxID=3135258 RepID=UPI0031391789
MTPTPTIHEAPELERGHTFRFIEDGRMHSVRPDGDRWMLYEEGPLHHVAHIEMSDAGWLAIAVNDPDQWQGDTLRDLLFLVLRS